MANTTVDSLQIEVQATSSKAASEINRLTEALQRLQGAARQPGLDRISRQLQGMAKTPSMAAMEKELARLEKQAIKDGDALLALQNKLEGLLQFKGIGNPLTVADTDSQIRETERQIRELSTAIDETDARIRALRQNLEAGPAFSVQRADPQLGRISETMAPVEVAARNVTEAFNSLNEAVRRVSDNLSSIAESANGLDNIAQRSRETSNGLERISETAGQADRRLEDISTRS